MRAVIGWGLLGGLLGGGLVVGVLATRKQRELERRGLVLARALETRGAAFEAYMLSKGSALEADLRMTAESLARQKMETTYGITPELIARLTRLHARLT